MMPECNGCKGYEPLPYEYACPNCIWRFRQNHPELIVQDVMRRFRLPDSAADELRNILRNRGCNKWFLARRRFIDLKHSMKPLLARNGSSDLRAIYTRMQNIAKAPRFVTWPTFTHRAARAEGHVIEMGRHC